MAVYVVCTVGAAILQIVVAVSGKADGEGDIEELIRIGSVTASVAPYDTNRLFPQAKERGQPGPPSAAPAGDVPRLTTPHVLSIPILRINSKDTLLRLPTIIRANGSSSNSKALSYPLK
uniref:Uncharacterized protein n=1 Tax=Heliothis virescens TaxID=7102 RepID=A0A2A4JWC0_HELVI